MRYYILVPNRGKGTWLARKRLENHRTLPPKGSCRHAGLFFLSKFQCYNFLNLREWVVAIKKVLFVSYGLLLSAIIGLIAAAFLVIEGFLTKIIWLSNSHFFQTFLIVVGSFILYFLLKRWPNLPKTSKDSLKELKQNQTIDYQDVFLNLLVTLVILSFGSGVGPEAALLSAIISLSIWQADNLRYFYFQYDELKRLSLGTAIKRLLNPFKYRQKYDEKIAPKTPKLLKWKKLFYVVFSINGLLAFALLIKQTDQPSFIMKLGHSHWQLSEFWIVPLLIIVGIVVGMILKELNYLFEKFIQHLNLNLAVRIALGALGIIAISYLEPNLLFSGQHSLHLLIGAWSNQSASFLFFMALLKLIFLIWCLTFNWRGGDIFPITFATMTVGFATAALLPNFDTLLVVAVLATTLMSELLSPIVAGIFIMLFFPITLTPIIILVAGVLFLKNKYLLKVRGNG